MITNQAMDRLLRKIFAEAPSEPIKVHIEKLESLFSPPFKKVKDCVIISNKSTAELEEHFDRAIKMYTDKTGYEASNSETRINCYFDEPVSVLSCTRIALLTVSLWAAQLKVLVPESKFCFIICSSNDHVEIRFHKVRSEESNWLDENLENYAEEAVGYIII